MPMIYGRDAELAKWAQDRISGAYFGDNARAIGYERGGRLRAVVVFDHFGPTDCQMHVASDGGRHWLTRELLAHAFAYPFVQLGLRRVSAVVKASNHAALRLDKHLGFQVEGIHPRVFVDDDAVSLGLLREACRFIPKEYRHA